jgi:hypothetical protein
LDWFVIGQQDCNFGKGFGRQLIAEPLRDLGDDRPAHGELSPAQGLYVDGVQTPDRLARLQGSGHLGEVAVIDGRLQLAGHLVEPLVFLGPDCCDTLQTGPIEVGHVPIDVAPRCLDATPLASRDLPEGELLITP